MSSTRHLLRRAEQDAMNEWLSEMNDPTMDPARVWRAVTRYEQIHRLYDSIAQSNIITPQSRGLFAR